MNKLPDISEVQPLSEKDEPLIKEIAAVLKKHNAIDRFGLTLLHQHFDTSDDEVMVEATDVDNRTQTIAPMPKVAIGDMPVIETAWRLDPDSCKPMMSCMCIKNPKGDHWMHLPRPSDRHLKLGVQPIEDAIRQIHQLRPVSYKYRQDIPQLHLPTANQLGFIAQEVEQIFPESVSSDDTGFKRIDYISLIPVLVAALQEQQQQIEDLRSELTTHHEAQSNELSFA
jgi:hypothetical protein